MTASHGQRGVHESAEGLRVLGAQLVVVGEQEAVGQEQRHKSGHVLLLERRGSRQRLVERFDVQLGDLKRSWRCRRWSCRCCHRPERRAGPAAADAAAACACRAAAGCGWRSRGAWRRRCATRRCA
jgi:hypothetical protein